MIKLSNSLSDVVKEKLNIQNRDNNEFSIEELNSVTEISLCKNDLEYLEYFQNVTLVNLELFPSVTTEDVQLIGHSLKKVNSLKIKEQNAIFNLDLSSFENLEELCVMHNDNLIDIKGVKDLKRFTFYDNKDFNNVEQLVNIIKNNISDDILIDIVYYYDLFNSFKAEFKNLTNIRWIESVGLRKFVTHEYTNEEIISLVDNIKMIVSKYTFVTDGDVEKFGVLYNWMINNISFVNEDDPKNEDKEQVNNVYKVFKHGKGGRLSFAKAFQLLLKFVGINSSVVYSMGALDTIGYYNGQKVYSLLGESDYAVLRVTLDGRYYYCDVAWDCLVTDFKFFDELKLFLLSKEELKLRHKFVGEGNITHSYSYHGDDSDELLQFSKDRINDVDETFGDIERLKSDITGVELNILYLNGEIEELNKKINEVNIDSIEYKKLFKDLIDVEEELEELENNLVKYENQREGIIESYSNFLITHYVPDYIVDIEALSTIKDECVISDYLLNILSICFKQKAA